MTDRLRRSFLYTPGDQERLVRNAVETGADGVIFDLEDAADNKDLARQNVRNVLPALESDRVELSVRLNGLHTDHWIDDLNAALAAGVDTIHLPMIEASWQVRTVESVVRTMDDDPPEFVLILETPRAIFSIGELLGDVAGLPQVTGVTFGMSDYARAVGASQTSDRIREFLSHWIVGHATMAGLDAFSSVYPDPHDLNTFREVARDAYEAGFRGQTTIHPDQAAIANEIFTPDADAVERARHLVSGFEAEDSGSVLVDGAFMDRAHVRRYRDLIERYEIVSERDDDLG